MALFTVKNKSIYHIHIPRTGGKYISELLRLNKLKPSFEHDVVYPRIDDLTLVEEFELEETRYQIFCLTYKGVIITHLHYPLYNEVSDKIKNAEKFAIIRDPYNRFISALGTTCLGIEHGYDWQRVCDDIKDRDYFIKFMDLMQNYSAYRSNCFRPQVDFIDEKTKIYRFEDGLDKNFIKWFEKNFSIEISEKDLEGNLLIDPKFLDDDCDKRKLQVQENLKIDPIIKEYVREFYAKDYEAFGY